MVGRFFEVLAQHVLGGELVRNDLGDLFVWEIDSGFEIKSSGSGSSHGHRLCVEQIRRYESSIGFPVDRYFYLFPCYRNRAKTVNGKRRTELSHYKRTKAVNDYISQNITSWVIVNLDVVLRWNEKFPHSTKSIAGQHRGKETVNIKPRYLEHFSNKGLRDGLITLGLNPGDFTRLSGLIESRAKIDLFREYSFTFPLVAILGHDEAHLLQKHMEKRGFCLQMDEI